MVRIAAVFAFVWSAAALGQGADLVLVNGKIVTVDERFRIVSALAIKDERIVAAGGNEAVQKLKGAGARVIDLKGRTVIPGLIDNHAHYMRAAEYWHREVRLDGVTSHKRALAMIGEKAKASQSGEWVVVLGGWSEEQFTDEPRGFTRAELDAVAPNNPAALQLFYFRVYANSLALKAMDKEEAADGALQGGANVGLLRAKLGQVAREKAAENARLIMHDLNSMGITAFQDQGGTGVKPEHMQAFRDVHDAKQMTVRSFWNYYEEPKTAADVDAAIGRMATLKPFQGDDWFDLTGWGETLFFPLHDALLSKRPTCRRSRSRSGRSSASGSRKTASTSTCMRSSSRASRRSCRRWKRSTASDRSAACAGPCRTSTRWTPMTSRACAA